MNGFARFVQVLKEASIMEFPIGSYASRGEKRALTLAQGKRADVEHTADGVEERSYDYTDPHGFQVRVTARFYAEFQAADWVVRFTNNGPENTPILSDMHPLDINLELADPDAPLLWKSIKGDICGEDSFLPVERSIASEESFRVTAQGGRSSNGNFPFFNLHQHEHGLICAIGWSGQWAASAERTGEHVSLRAGMEYARLYLKPGESIRTPRILIMAWQGDVRKGQNTFRKLMMKYFSPKTLRNSDAYLPATLQTFDRYIGQVPEWVTEAGQIKSVELAAKCELFDTYWLDAGWFKGYFPNGVGNYTYAEGFPNGLRPVADAAHAKGLNFVLWFEPERVVEDTELYNEHRDWLLDVKGRTRENNPEKSQYLFYILNIGNSDVREWLTNKITHFIQEIGIDVYRQDFNIDPLQFWLEHDDEDRVGYTEIKYIEGLYEFWDTLLERFPGLLIDNCASGGRRLDIETCARSAPLWRSDTGCIPTRRGWESDVWNHNQVLGLSQFLPWHATASWSAKAYDFRSAATLGIAGNFDVFSEQFDFAEAKEALAEYRRFRPYWKGDFYPLTEAAVDEKHWAAYQFDNGGGESGIVTFFRRAESPYSTLETDWQALRPEARYRLLFVDEERQSTERVMPGRDLMNGFAVTLPLKRSSLIVEYTLCD